MKILKQIFFPLFSLFLLYQSLELLILLNSGKLGQLNTFQSVLIGFVLSLFITGVFAFLGFAYPTGNLMPESYYKIKNPKKLYAAYKVLGVKYFKIFLLVTFWGKEKNRKKYFNGTKTGIRNFIYQTRQSEFGHLAALVIVAVINLYVLWKGYYTVALSLFILNIFGNLYPVVLQRYHRMRIGKIVVGLDLSLLQKPVE